MLDVVILVIAFVLSLVSAFIISGIKGAQLLLPLDPRHPVPPVGKATLFRFTRLGDIQNDHTAWKARGLLALILFVMFVLLGKVLETWIDRSVAADWSFTLKALAVVVSVWLFVVGRLINAFVVAIMTVVPILIAEFVTGGVNVPGATMWMGLCGGLVHLYAGIYLSLNWRSLVYRTRLELRHNQTVSGEELGTLGRISLTLYLWTLRGLPFVILYQAVVYWAPQWELMRLVGYDNLPQPLVIAVGSLSLGMAMNIALFIVPVFRELMEKTNLQAAADFSKAVLKRHAMQSERAEIKEDDDPVKDFVGKEGQWLTFQSDQLTPFVLVVSALIVNSVGQTLAKGLAAGLVPAEATHEGGISVAHVAAVMSAMSFWINAMFLLGTASMLETESKKQKNEEAEKFTRRMRRAMDDDGGEFDPTDESVDAARVNALVAWEAARNPELTVTCADIGGDPRVLIVEPGTVPTPGATTPAE
ncbi:MAG: hypothetical protein AB7K09_01315 [Planctomycetota bacterium]